MGDTDRIQDVMGRVRRFQQEVNEAGMGPVQGKGIEPSNVQYLTREEHARLHIAGGRRPPPQAPQFVQLSDHILNVNQIAWIRLPRQGRGRALDKVMMIEMGTGTVIEIEPEHEETLLRQLDPLYLGAAREVDESA